MEVSVQVCSREIWNDRRFLENLEATYLVTLPLRTGWPDRGNFAQNPG